MTNPVKLRQKAYGDGMENLVDVRGKACGESPAEKKRKLSPVAR
jgi:hypothetical protein